MGQDTRHSDKAAELFSILGFVLRGTTLRIDPCLQRAWPGFEIVFRHGGSRYDISVENPRGVSRGVTAVELDGETLTREVFQAGSRVESRERAMIPLVDDGKNHRVRVVLG